MAKTLTYILEFKTKKAQEGIDQVIATNKELRKVLKSVPEEGTEAFNKLDAEVRQASNGTTTLKQRVNELTNAYAQGQAQIRDFNRSLRSGVAEAGSINALRQQVISVNRELDNTKIGTERYKELSRASLQLTEDLKKAEAQSGRFQRNVGNYGQIGEAISRTFKDVGREIASAFSVAAVVGAAQLAFTSFVSTARDFTKEIANVKAISQATDEQFEALSAEAQRLGAATAFSATSAAEGMTEFARAGFTTKEIIAAVGPALNLATAGSTDLALASNLTATAIRTYNRDASAAAEITNQIAFTANSAQTTVEAYNESFKAIGPIAAALKIPLEDVNATIGLIGDRGITGSAATTTLKTALVRLAGDIKPVREEMAKLNLEVFDQNGQFIGVGNLLEELGERYKDYTDEQRAASLSQLFGNRSISQWQILLESTDKQLTNTSEELGKGADAFREYSAAIAFAGDGVDLVSNTVSNLSGVTLQDLRTSFTQTNATFGQFRGTSAQTLATLAALNQTGETTEAQANSLAVGFQNVIANAEALGITTTEQVEVFNELGEATGETEERFVGTASLVSQLEENLKGLSASQRQQALVAQLGADGAEQYNRLLDTSITTTNKFGEEVTLTGVAALQKLEEQANKSANGIDGFAQRTSAVQLDSFAGALTILESATEGLQLALFGLVEEELTGFVVGFQEAVSAAVEFINSGGQPLNDWIQENKGLLTILSAIIGAYTARLVAARIATLASAAAEALANKERGIGLVVSRAAAAGQAIYSAAVQLVTGRITLARAAQLAWNLVLSANPIGIVVTALGALAGAVAFAYQNSQEFRATLAGVWEALEEVGTAVYTFFITPFRTGVDLIKGLGSLLSGDFDAGLEQLTAAFTDRIDDFNKVGEDIGSAFSEGYQGKVREEALENVQDLVSGFDVDGARDQLANAGSDEEREQITQKIRDDAQAIREELKAAYGEGLLDDAELAKLNGELNKRVGEIFAVSPEAVTPDVPTATAEDPVAKEVRDRINEYREAADELSEARRNLTLAGLEESRALRIQELTEDEAFAALSLNQQLLLLKEENDKINEERRALQDQRLEQLRAQGELEVNQTRLIEQQKVLAIREEGEARRAALQAQLDAETISQEEYAAQVAQVQIDTQARIAEARQEAIQGDGTVEDRIAALREDLEERRAFIQEQVAAETEATQAVYEAQQEGIAQLFGSEEEFAEARRILAEQGAEALREQATNGPAADALIDAEQTRQQALLEIQAQGQTQQLELLAEFAEQRSALYSEQTSQIEQAETEALNARKVGVDRQIAEQRRLALSGEQTFEESEAKIKTIIETSESETLQIRLDFANQRLAAAEIGGEDYIAIQEEVYDLEQEIAQDQIDLAKATAEAQVEATEEALERIDEFYGELQSGIDDAFGLINDIFDAQSEAIEGNIEEIEERREGVIEASNQAQDAIRTESRARIQEIKDSNRSQAEKDRLIAQEEERARNAIENNKAETAQTVASLDAQAAAEEERAARVQRTQEGLARAQAALSFIVAAAKAAETIALVGSQTGVGAAVAIPAVIAALAAGIAAAKALFSEEGGEIQPISNRNSMPVREQYIEYRRGGGAAGSGLRAKRVRRVPRNRKITFGKTHSGGGILTELERGEWVVPVPTVEMFKPALQWMTDQGNRRRKGQTFALTPPNNIFDERVGNTSPSNYIAAAPSPRRPSLIANGYAQEGGEAAGGSTFVIGDGGSGMTETLLLEQNQLLTDLITATQQSRSIAVDPAAFQEEIDFVNGAEDLAS